MSSNRCRAGQWSVAGFLASQEVVSVITHKLDGTVLWEWGEPQAGVARLGYDVACHIHDWDGDGILEVIVDPEDAADCLTFVNLSGGERATDVLMRPATSRS